MVTVKFGLFDREHGKDRGKTVNCFCVSHGPTQTHTDKGLLFELHTADCQPVLYQPWTHADLHGQWVMDLYVYFDEGFDAKAKNNGENHVVGDGREVPREKWVLGGAIAYPD